MPMTHSLLIMDVTRVQATCGGCHMVVLARPRDPRCGDVALEEEDTTEDFLERPYVELLGETGDSSTLHRSLCARVRRRERVGGRRSLMAYETINFDVSIGKVTAKLELLYLKM